MSEWTDLDAAADGYDDAMKELAGLRQLIAELERDVEGYGEAYSKMMRERDAEVAKLKAELGSALFLIDSLKPDADRLAWGIKHPREFYEACQRRLMAGTEERVEIDAAMREGE